ncbi:MAG: InlB B-repeat-containing protein, partial [Clostridia bacterium]|nr:InlB B-repeat-containing protein [Clostridia bacterium]
MKKAKIIGKKTLSVFLAVLMVLTAWVWVAPTEASAIDAGTYYVRVSYYCDDKYDGGSAYTGTSFTGEGAGYAITYAANNGQGTSDEKVINLTDECKSNFTTKSKVTVCEGFPTAVHYYNRGGTIFSRTYGITKVEVASTSTGTWHTLWEGNIEADAASTAWKARIDKNGATKVNTGTGGWETWTAGTTTWESPKANEVVWDATPSNFTIPNSTYGRTHCVDQYGVTLGVNPTDSFTSTPTTGLSGSTSNGTTYSQYTITASNSARMLTLGTNSRSVKMTASYTFGGATVSDSKSFTITDPKYTITFNKNASNASNMAPATYSVYYGESLASQAVIDNASTYPTAGNRTGHTFIGMYDAAEGGNLMNINEAVTATKTYYAHWEKLKYAAVFLDRSGNDVVLVQNNIEHESAATKADEAASKLNRIEFDDVNHYVLNESNVWTPSTDSVTGNTFFYPNYVASAHTLDAGTAIEATCQHGAGIEYKCTGCNYSYIEETSTELGEHAKSESYIVDTEATCTTAGSGHYFCTVCGATLDTVTIPAKGHSFKVEVTKDATCTKEGTRTYTCTVCDYSEEETIPLAQHNYVAGETVAATCQHSPYTPYTCSICGDSYNKYEGNATTNHNWDITVSDVTADNTKIVTGTCSVCNATFTKVVELPATHNFTNIAITKQPTCKAEGEITISCADTGCIESYTATLPAVSTAHSEYTTTYTPATCGAKGSVVTKCKDCGVTIKETEIAALNHSYNYVRVEPTCTTAGSITKTCANCNDVQTEPISATGHKTVTVEANCQHGGYEKCGVCGETLSETPKKAHNYAGEVKEVPATCTVDGIRFTKCTDCDAQIADILGKTGHDTNAEWVEIIPATCTGKGLKTKTCSRCGIVLDSQEINALDHDYKKDESASYAPTCTTAGAEAEKCSRCGDINITVIQPIGHDWNSGVRTEATCTSGGYITYTCQRNGCGETRIDLINGSTALTHDFDESIEENVEIVKAATCEADGKKTVKCTRCDAVNEVIIPKLGHSYGAWDKTTNPATNDKDGTWTRECANCHDVETITIPKGGHNLVEISKTNAKCNEKGSVTYGCTAHTNCPITVTVELDYAQHSVATRENPAATCKAEGKVESYCTVCGEVFSSVATPVKAHNFVAQTAVAPTCTTAGYTPYKCSACDFTYNVFDGAQATGHNYKVTTTDATCTATGLKTFTCDCGDSYTEEIPATGHNHVKGTVTNASCTTAGTEVYTCACGDTYTKFIEAAKGHSWGEYVETQAATADNYGIKERTCSVCGAVEIAKIAPIGDHVFIETITTSATCTTDGLKTFTCSEHTNCSANYTEKIPATGHKGVLNYTAPTCYSEGSTQIVCETCDAEITEAISIPTTAHTYGEGKVTTAATCTSDGVMTFTCTVAECGATRTEVIEKSGHDLTTTVTDATCGATGSVVTECAKCNDPAVENTVELAAKGHIWGTTPIDTEAATCETDGSETYKCQNCDAENVVVLPKLGHNWSDWTVVPSTNGTPGSVSRTCSVCNEVEKVDIPAGGHSLVEDTTKYVAPSCTAEGKKVYKCENHDDCGITLEVAVPVTQHTVVQRELEATCKAEGS